MKKLYDINAGDKPKASDIQQCIDAIRELQTQPLGPGLGKTSDGTIYVTTKQAQQTLPFKGTAKELNHVQGTQDTDYWDAATEKKPVYCHVLTDWGYNEDTHELYFRTRRLMLVSGAIGPESTIVVCHTAEEHV